LRLIKMSSESAPNRPRSQTRSSGPTTVIPQLVTDPTILDSVAGFINEVVPTTYTGPSDMKDQIQWAHFEKIDCDNSTLSPNYEYEKFIPSVIILVLGYTTGIQIWAIPANGEATEILSWRHGSVRILRVLPGPTFVGNLNNLDIFATKRPLMAVCDNAPPGSHFCSLNFLSLKTGEQVKLIKFKNAVLDVLANKHSVVVTFQEKIAVFDAFTLEDRLTVTTCYLSPGLQPNPVALGTRWMAYAEKKLNPSKRSSGGNDGEGVQSYTATVIHAAKSLGRGLRELGESVASSLTGNPNFKPGTSPNSPQAGGQSDIPQKGIVTILDIECLSAQNTEKPIQPDAIVAHFTAHTEAIVHLQFDPSGLLLLTADKRGHDFHLFRIHPHPGGPALAAVHHLYILHRGDTSARVQDMCFSPDSRWATVSTLRGTTHVFPITPYGGNVGVRTHATPHVVNKMSRFHRSAGRQRLSSSSEDNIALRVVTCFAPPRAWIDASSRETPLSKQVKPVESLFIMSCHGTLVQYDLDPHQSSNVPKERVCSDTPIELTVCARAQWLVQRQPGSLDLPLPMPQEYLNYFAQDVPLYRKHKPDHNDDHWLSQVEIVTHAGPHRRLWMGPQFTFKTYTTTSGSPMSEVEAQPIDLGHTKPVNMPITKANAVLIESSSASSCEQSLLDTYHRTFEEVGGAGELQLKEDLADAMLESPGIRETGGRCVIVQMKPAVAKVVNPLGTVVNVQSDDDTDVEICEDIIIHENCDEALFRPVVAPKAVLYHEKTKRYGDNIITKSLDSTTEVAVKILNKNFSASKSNKMNLKSRESSPKSVKEKTKQSKVKSNLASEQESAPKSTKSKCKPESKMNIDISDPFIDIPDFKSVLLSKSLKEAAKIPIPEPLEKINVTLNVDNKDFSFELPQLDNEDFFSLENIPKADKFEDARECNEIVESFSNKVETTTESKSKKDKYSGLDDSSDNTNTSEDNIIEEKPVAKRSRKPKAKLGVKIGTFNKEKSNTEKIIEDCSAEITLPAPPKKSWSTIAASKPVIEKLIIDNTEKEKDIQLDLPEIDYVEEFTVQLPKKCSPYVVTSDLIDINTPQEEKEMKEDIKKDLETVKADSSSSPAEVGESDDSGKAPNIEISAVFEEMTESKSTIITSKSARRKKRKKLLQVVGGEQAADCVCRDVEDLSSASSFSSASRASPTPSYGETLLHFPGDSSSSM
ncbi:hypothetical protein NQ314_015675, partial [Rhamnusium bicolor]